MKLHCLSIVAVLTLAACEQAAVPPAQRIELGDAHPAPSDVMEVSPDTSDGFWAVDPNGHAIRFGNDGEEPLMSLVCELSDRDPQMAIIRHTPARPGLTALFPVVGNGMRSRFLTDAVLAEGEWRWEASVPASDPKLDVFTGTRQLLATLPGRGILDIHGSRIPGEFVTWCRAGGQTIQVQDESDAEIEANADLPEFN